MNVERTEQKLEQQGSTKAIWSLSGGGGGAVVRDSEQIVLTVFYFTNV